MLAGKRASSAMDGKFKFILESGFRQSLITGVRYKLNEKKWAYFPDAVRKWTLFNVYLPPVISVITSY